MLSITVLCAESEKKANELRKLSDYTLLKFETGKFEPMNRYEDIADYLFSPEEEARIYNNRGRIVSGTPSQVKAELTHLADIFGVDEIIVTTMTYSQEDRIRSFELLAEVFELTAEGP